MDIESARAAADAHAASRARADEALRRSAQVSADMEARRYEEPAPGNNLLASANAATVRHEELEARQPAVQRAAPVARQTQQPVATMTPEVQAAWDAWVRGHIRNALVKHDRTLMKGIGEGMARYVGKRIDSLTDVLGEETAAIENRLRAELDANVRTAGQLLGRVMALEASRDGRELSRIGDRHVG